MKCPRCSSENVEGNEMIKNIMTYVCKYCGFVFTKENKMKEICICAAIRCEDGTIIRGHQHRDARDGAIRRGKKPVKEWGAEGFVTSKNRFVDREEGFKLMKAIGWKSKNPQGYQLCEWLWSEDLY